MSKLDEIFKNNPALLEEPKVNKGFVKISNALYVSDWKRLFVFMKDFRPTHIEFRYWENDTWYIYGVSEKFDVLQKGEAVPQYHVIFTESCDNDLAYKFERV